MIQKNRALHELPDTEIEKSGPIRLAIEVNLTVLNFTIVVYGSA